MQTLSKDDPCENPECQHPVMSLYVPFCINCYFFLPEDLKPGINAAANYKRLYQKWPSDFEERKQEAITAIQEVLAER